MVHCSGDVVFHCSRLTTTPHKGDNLESALRAKDKQQEVCQWEGRGHDGYALLVLSITIVELV